MLGAIRRTLIAAALLAALAVALPFLVPLDQFIPELERTASQKLGQRVTIADLRLKVLPTPRAVARGISVGKNHDLIVAELEIIPELLSLFSEARSIRMIHLGKVQLSQAAFSIPRAMPSRPVGKPLRVKRVLLTEVTLRHPWLKLGEFDLDLALGEGLRLRQATLQTRDGAMTLRFKPQGAKLTALTLRAAEWTLPAGAPFTFAALTAEGTLKGEELEVSKIAGTLYGGSVAGSTRVDWSRRQWQVSGDAKLAGVDLASLQQALGRSPQLSGKLHGSAVFSTRAIKAEELRDALKLRGPFEVLGGAYQGVDLSKAGDLSGQPGLGDATPFKELKGNVEVAGRRTRINELCMRSPNLVAGGTIEIAPDQSLSGKLDISVAKTGGFVGIPVALGGTTSEPHLAPTKGYLIGAAIGTVLLPGIGTSIGSALGSRIDGTSDCK